MAVTQHDTDVIHLPDIVMPDGRRSKIAIMPRNSHRPDQPRCIYLGESVDKIKTICADGKEAFQAANVCTAPAHQLPSGKPGRCLPMYHPIGKGLENWNEREESKLVHLCAGCEHLKRKESTKHGNSST